MINEFQIPMDRVENELGARFLREITLLAEVERLQGVEGTLRAEIERLEGIIAIQGGNEFKHES